MSMFFFDVHTVILSSTQDLLLKLKSGILSHAQNDLIRNKKYGFCESGCL